MSVAANVDDRGAAIEAAPARRASWQVALAFGIAHLVVVLAAQFENAFFHAFPASDAGALLLARLPLLQLENLVATAALVLAARVLAWRRAGWWAMFAVVLVLDAVVVADQLGYKVFYDHLKCSYAEEGAAGLMSLGDSLRALVDVRFWFNCVVTVASLTALGKWFGVGRVRWLAQRRWKAAIRRWRALVWALGGSWIAAAVWVTSTPGLMGLDHYPVAALAADCTGLNRAEPVVAAAPVAGFQVLRRGHVTPPPRIEGRPWRRADGRRLNVVLLVLESIGARQLLADGRPRADVAPFLHRLSDHALVYDSVYSTYPASIVTNLSITTGGPTLSWGKVAELDRRYTGPTLVGELGRAGYATGLFSSAELDFGNLGAFFGALGYDELFDFARSPAGFRAANVANSWGADDGDVLRLAAAWARDQADAGKPFYLRVQTNLAHHPYTTPPGYHTAIEEARPERRRYLEAIHYLDSLIARFHSQFESAGLADDTLFVFTGDHGEAFGEWHPTNYLHRNALYEENVRSFLMIANRSRIAHRWRSSVPAFVGDILPTVLGLQGIPTPSGIPGQDLSSGRYRPRMVFVHKNNHPESWALRDGRWKFIATFSGDRFELYDLAADPTEQHNLAPRHPRWTADYQDTAATWYVARNDQFTRRLQGRTRIGARELLASDMATRGPKVLAVGHRRDDGRQGFVEARRFNPREPITVWTKWVSYRRRTAVEYRWTAPDGATHGQVERVGPDDVITEVAMRVPGPLAAGQWGLELLRDGKRLLATGFEVAAAEPLHDAAHVPIAAEQIRPLAVERGEQRELVRGESLAAGARLDIAMAVAPAARDRLLTLRWRSPGGREFSYQARVAAGAAELVVHHGGPYPMEPGTWWLRVMSVGTQVGSKLVRVAVPRSVPTARAAGATSAPS